jgi:hypothetical protein
MLMEAFSPRSIAESYDVLENKADNTGLDSMHDQV